MQDLLSRLTSSDLSAIVAMVLVFVPGMIICLARTWRLHRRAELEAALKHEMLTRGMSAGDIERVLNATLGGGRVRIESSEDSVAEARSRLAR